MAFYVSFYPLSGKQDISRHFSLQVREQSQNLKQQLHTRKGSAPLGLPSGFQRQYLETLGSSEQLQEDLSMKECKAKTFSVALIYGRHRRGKHDATEANTNPSHSAEGWLSARHRAKRQRPSRLTSSRAQRQRAATGPRLRQIPQRSQGWEQGVRQLWACGHFLQVQGKAQ